MPIVDDFLNKSGIDGYHTIGPRASMGTGNSKDKYGDKVCLLENVDCTHTLVTEQPEDVAQAIQCIKVRLHEGGHVLEFCNSIHSDVRFDNSMVVLGISSRYGR